MELTINANPTNDTATAAISEANALAQAQSPANGTLAHGQEAVPETTQNAEEGKPMATATETPSMRTNSVEWPQGSKGADYHPVYHGSITDALAQMNSRNAREDKVAKTYTVQANSVELTLTRALTFGAGTHKLLSRAVQAFTECNPPGATNLKCRVSFPAEEYARLIGETSIERRPTSTPEEAEAEKKRLENAWDNFLKKLNAAMKPLHEPFSATERVRGKSRRYININLIGYSDINNRQVVMEFTGRCAEYLVTHPLTQIPDSLYRVPDRHQNAYILGLRLAEHYNNENNQIAGTADRLKVETLLGHMNLRSIDTLREEKLSWEYLKEPFEDALEELHAIGMLDDWEYAWPKGIPLTDAEARTILTYEQWLSLYVRFRLVNPPDHSEAIAAAKKRQSANAKKTESKAAKAAKKGDSTPKKKTQAGE